MSKLKTRKSVSNRFKKTSSGKVKNKKPGRSHLKAKQKGKKTREQRKDQDSAKQYEEVVETMDPYS
ncbi:MAG: 50S ribosomal protein L35 [Candidatus Magasanikbacteria bacterium]